MWGYIIINTSISLFRCKVFLIGITIIVIVLATIIICIWAFFEKKKGNVPENDIIIIYYYYYYVYKSVSQNYAIYRKAHKHRKARRINSLKKWEWLREEFKTYLSTFSETLFFSSQVSYPTLIDPLQLCDQKLQNLSF